METQSPQIRSGLVALASLIFINVPVLSANRLDTTPPSVSVKDVTVALDINGMARISPEDVDNGSSDNVSIASTTLDVYRFDASCLGKNTVVFTAKDKQGN